MRLEQYLTGDDRAVLPLGQLSNAYLSLETDNTIAERLAVEAANPLGVPVMPVLAYGVTGFVAYSGSPTLEPVSTLRRRGDGARGRLVRRRLPASRHGRWKPLSSSYANGSRAAGRDPFEVARIPRTSGPTVAADFPGLGPR
jgi:creatinine amidohydrolase